MEDALKDHLQLQMATTSKLKDKIKELQLAFLQNELVVRQMTLEAEEQRRNFNILRHVADSMY